MKRIPIDVLVGMVSLTFFLTPLSGEEDSQAPAKEKKQSSASTGSIETGEENSFDPFFGSNWDPFAEMQAIQERMNRLFEESFNRSAQSSFQQKFGSSSSMQVFSPDVDLEEAPDAFTVRAALPGYERDQIDLEISGNVLTISGRQERKEQTDEESAEGQRFYFRETRFGSFSRSVTIPGEFDEDRVTAEFKNGVLTVTLPKLKTTVPKESKKITVV